MVVKDNDDDNMKLLYFVVEFLEMCFWTFSR